MARAPKSLSDVQRQFLSGKPMAARRKSSGKKDPEHVLMPGSSIARMELVSLVLKYFCGGMQAQKIVDAFAKNHGLHIGREVPYNVVSYAAQNGWLRYMPPVETTMRTRLKERYPFLSEIDIVETAVFDDVASQGALALVNLLRRQRQLFGKEEVHVGFAGGISMRKLAQALATFLRSFPDGLPRKIVFHAMAAGFDIHDPTTAPNSFATYFVTEEDVRPSIRFIGLNSSAVVESKNFHDAKKLPGIKDAFDLAGKLDIIVTSASRWRDEHSMLLKCMMRDEESVEVLKNAGCDGDMLWRPIGKEGPIEIDTKIRAVTLVELSDLVPIVKKKDKSVLLVIGPCGGCNRHKAEILETILSLKNPIISNLVVDSRTARVLVGRME